VRNFIDILPSGIKDLLQKTTYEVKAEGEAPIPTLVYDLKAYPLITVICYGVGLLAGLVEIIVTRILVKKMKVITANSISSPAL
jgi:hypothetical protein